MAEYNWNERHIITFPKDIMLLKPKTFMYYYGQKKLSMVLICSSKKTKSQPLSVHLDAESPLLRSLNRMNDTIDIAKVTGEFSTGN